MPVPLRQSKAWREHTGIVLAAAEHRCTWFCYGRCAKRATVVIGQRALCRHHWHELMRERGTPVKTRTKSTG